MSNRGIGFGLAGLAILAAGFGIPGHGGGGPVTSPTTTLPATTTTVSTTTVPGATTTTGPTTTTTIPPTGCPAPGNANNLFPCATQNGGQAGVPVGAVLTAYTGPTTITSCGTVIDHKLITAPITVQAANSHVAQAVYSTEAAAQAAACVTFTNDKIAPISASNGDHGVELAFNGATTGQGGCGGATGTCGPVYLANTEIAMPQNPTTGSNSTFAISVNNYHAWRVYLHGTTQGAACDGWCDIHDSLVLADRGNSTNEAHMDPFIVNSNSNSLTVGHPILLDHDTFFCGSTSSSQFTSTENGSATDCSGDVGLFSDPCCGGGQGVNNVAITNSYMPCGAGCGNTVCWNFAPKTITNSFNAMTLEHNQFDTNCTGGANSYGGASPRTGSIWCDNRYTNNVLNTPSLENGPSPGVCP